MGTHLYLRIAYWIFGSFDRWMLAILSNNTEVGLYSIAFRFSFFLTLVNSSFGQAWSPYAIKLFGERTDYKIISSRIFSY